MIFKKNRAAIAMIELIFSIVIIGLTLMSAPMLISQATSSGYIAIQQESIAAAASQIGLVMTRYWDEQDANKTKGSPILTTTYTAAGNVPLVITATTPRPGMVLGSSSRTIVFADGTLGAASTSLQTDGNDSDDIDDFNGLSYGLEIFNSETIDTATGDYIDSNITISVVVAYGNDVPSTVAGAATANGYADTTITYSNPFLNTAVAGATSNVKLINVNLTTNESTPELSKSISLSAFSCNIGAYDTKRRSK